jgi:iron(III) transport system substrate-binding protein
MQSLYVQEKINFLPANAKVQADPTMVDMLKNAKVLEIDDNWAGANRERIVARWIAEVLNS